MKIVDLLHEEYSYTRYYFINLQRINYKQIDNKEEKIIKFSIDKLKEDKIPITIKVNMKT